MPAFIITNTYGQILRDDTDVFPLKFLDTYNSIPTTIKCFSSDTDARNYIQTLFNSSFFRILSYGYNQEQLLNSYASIRDEFFNLKLKDVSDLYGSYVTDASFNGTLELLYSLQNAGIRASHSSIGSLLSSEISSIYHNQNIDPDIFVFDYSGNNLQEFLDKLIANNNLSGLADNFFISEKQTKVFVLDNLVFCFCYDLGEANLVKLLNLNDNHWACRLHDDITNNLLRIHKILYDKSIQMFFN